MKENPVNGNELVAFEIFSRSEPLTQNRAEFFGLRSMARIIVRWHWQPGRQKRESFNDKLFRIVSSGLQDNSVKEKAISAVYVIFKQTYPSLTAWCLYLKFVKGTERDNYYIILYLIQILQNLTLNFYSKFLKFTDF